MRSRKEEPRRPGASDSQEIAVLDREMANDIRTEANPVGLETLRLSVTPARATDGK